jgi:subtilisin family serine protease
MNEPQTVIRFTFAGLHGSAFCSPIEPCVFLKKGLLMNVFARGQISRMVLCAAVAALSSVAVSAQPSGQGASHPFGQSQPIADRYIVVFKDSVANPAAEAAGITRAAGGQLHHTYSTAIKGFAASLPAAALQGLRSNPNVNYIEQDQTVSLSADVQSGATWGLDRIDETARLLDGLYHYNGTGAGVHAYIIDTGIRADHVEFTGRLGAGTNTVADNNGTNDCNGHGTHVSGTVGGTTWGVAKQVKLHPVRVLDCRGSGTWSGVIAGVDWVANNRVLPAVANMSLGGGLSSSVNAAVAGAVSSGVTMVVAAGNSNANACNYSPASEPTALTVGATTNTDTRASYSNYGSCVDLFAPGSSITSSWNTSSTAINTISGTSMASPHVTGVAALVSQANPDASPAAIGNFIVTHANVDMVGSAGSGSPNLLLYSLATGTATPPTATQVAVKDLTGSSFKSGRNWKAKAVVTMFNTATGAAMANVTVSGAFDTGGSSNCTTGSTGSCTLSSGSISSGYSATKLTITGASGPNMTYDATMNVYNFVIINKP